MNLLNISNHKSSQWSEAQKNDWSEITDLQFPNIPADWSDEQVVNLAAEYCEKIGEFIADNPDGKVMLQGEFSFCYIIFTSIEDKIFVFPTTERKVVETINPDGTVNKTAVFEFVKWRMK